MAKDKRLYRKVCPVGHLYVQGRDYFLLNLNPIQPDWEWVELERRFAVVPTTSIDVTVEEVFYSYARHIVIRGDYFIEYTPTIGEINVWDLGMIDLSEQEETDPVEEPEWNQLELTDMIRSMEESNG